MEIDWTERDWKEVYRERHPNCIFIDEQEPEIGQVVTMIGDNWTFVGRYEGNHIWRDPNDGHEVDFDICKAWEPLTTPQK